MTYRFFAIMSWDSDTTDRGRELIKFPLKSPTASFMGKPSWLLRVGGGQPGAGRRKHCLDASAQCWRYNGRELR